MAPLSTAYRLKNLHRNQVAHIVGRGPSLRRLRATAFDGGPVIVLNHAIIKVQSLDLSNPVYSMQKDGLCYEGLRGEHLLVHAREAGNIMRHYHPRTIWDNMTDFQLRTHEPSALSALAFAKLMGCRDAILHCFDSFDGELRTCDQKGGKWVLGDYCPDLYRLFVPRIKGQLQKLRFSGGLG